MAIRSRVPIGPLIAVGVLTVLLCLGVVYVYVGWGPLTGAPGFSMTVTGYVAMALGLIAAVLLGIGLATLIIYGKRKD